MLNTTNSHSVEDWRRTLDALPDLICTLDSAHKVRWMNAAMAKKLGMTLEEANGLACYEVVHGTTCPPDYCPHRQMLQDHQEHEVEIHEERLGGDFLVTCMPQRDERGQLVGSVYVARDITKRKRAERELQKSEVLYRSFFQSNPHPMWVYDLETLRFLAVNDAAISHYGYSLDEFLTMTIKDIRPPEDLPRLYKNLEELPVEGIDNAGAWRHLKKDRSVIDVEITSHMLEFDGHKSELVLAHDITARRQAEDRLRQSNERLKKVLEVETVGVMFWDLTTGCMTDANDTFLNMMGYSRADVESGSLTWQKLTPPEYVEASLAEIRKFQETGRVGPYEKEYFRKDGTRQWMVFAGSSLGEENCVEFCVDISDRMKAEAELRESEERFRRAVTGAPFPIMIHAEDGQVVTLNIPWTRLTGYELSDIPTIADWTRKAYGTQMDLVQSDIDSLYALDGPKAEGEYTITTSSGDSRIWDFSSAPIGRMPDGRRLVISMAMDVTERKHAEEKKEKLHAQLAQAQKIESVGRLAGGVAHDFNNMLGVILGYAKLAQEGLEPDQPLYADLDEICKATERSADLTRQLLAFARKQTVAPKVLDLNETVEGMLKMLRRLIGENIYLVWRPVNSKMIVFIDPSQVDQILANLCVNARDAIADVGKIIIETGAVTFDEDYCAGHAGFIPGKFVMLAVSDNGCGMDATTLDHLFEPFFTTKELGKGTGLGLSTVYGAVKQNNGFINVYSELGHGTTIKIYLPLYLAKAILRPEQNQDPTQAATGQIILLVEDEAVLLKLTARMLKRLGYTVIAASTPGEAIRLGRERQGRIDLLMTDVVMPEMNGRDLAGNILSLYPDIKRLFMSGYTANVIAHHGVLDPGVHFLQKPFSMQQMAAKVREALDG